MSLFIIGHWQLFAGKSTGCALAAPMTIKLEVAEVYKCVLLTFSITQVWYRINKEYTAHLRMLACDLESGPQ